MKRTAAPGDATYIVVLLQYSILHRSTNTKAMRDQN